MYKRPTAFSNNVKVIEKAGTKAKRKQKVICNKEGSLKHSLLNSVHERGRHELQPATSA